MLQYTLVVPEIRTLKQGLHIKELFLKMGLLHSLHVLQNQYSIVLIYIWLLVEAKQQYFLNQII